jgi:hypothetical protein
MADQLAETLGDGSYARPLANLVQLAINGRVQDTIAAPDLVPAVPSGPVELITGTSSVGELLPQPGHGTKVQPRLGEAQIGSGTVTAVAASPSSDRPPQLAVAVQNPAGGCVVEVQPGGQGAYKNYPLTGSDAACSSLSYDPNGNLWAAAGSGVWVLSPGRSPTSVGMSAMTSAIQPTDQILALQMAPDAVRAALLVKTPGTGNQLLLAAVHVRRGTVAFDQPVTVGTAGLTNPAAISWYDGYHVAVLAAEGIYSVPLTTGAGQQPAPQLITPLPIGVQSQTLTTDGKELVVGAIQGASQVVYAEEASSPGSWSSVANGWDPVYPG